MANIPAQWIGIIAGVTTAASMLPQLIKVIKEKEASDLSGGMLATLISGLVFWVIYGIMKNDIPIIATNGFSVLLNIVLVFFKIKYKNRT